MWFLSIAVWPHIGFQRSERCHAYKIPGSGFLETPLRTDTSFPNGVLWASYNQKPCPDSKVHGANVGPTWVLSVPGGPHAGLMNLAIWVINRARASTGSSNITMRLTLHPQWTSIKKGQKCRPLIFSLTSAWTSWWTTDELPGLGHPDALVCWS